MSTPKMSIQANLYYYICELQHETLYAFTTIEGKTLFAEITEVTEQAVSLWDCGKSFDLPLSSIKAIRHATDEECL